MLRRYVRWQGLFCENPDELQYEEKRRNRLCSKLLRDKSNPWSLPEAEFRSMFRLSNVAAFNVLNEILEINPSLKMIYANAIPFHLKLLATLNLLAHGSDQKPTGDNRIYCQSQPMVSRSLHLVLHEILKLCGRYITFPTTPAEIASNKVDFLEKLQLPGIVCAIDGTHVSIVQPPAEQNGYLYFNRKGYYSLNVLAACDAHGSIVYADANYPGSVHDSAIYQLSGLKQKLREPNSFMLGDSGFPSDHCMLTPVLEPRTRKQERYNVTHKHARNVVERTFGRLKMRFRCLKRHRTLHYKPTTAAKIIYACIVLHNICILNGEVDFEDEIDEDGEEEVEEGPAGENANNHRMRDQYIERNF